MEKSMVIEGLKWRRMVRLDDFMGQYVKINVIYPPIIF